LQVQAQTLDQNYLHQWAAELGLAELLAQATREAGLAENFSVDS
jgi:hypothetical protein